MCARRQWYNFNLAATLQSGRVSDLYLGSNHHQRHSLIVEGQVFIVEPARSDELLPRLKLAYAPAAIAKIFVKNNYRTFSKSLLSHVENDPGGLVGIAIDVDEREGFGMLAQEWRQRLVEPAFDQCDIGGNRR